MSDKMQMPFQKLLFIPLALFSLNTSAPASSEECLVCTPVLRMNEARAACINERHSEFARQADESDFGVVFFNIDDCAYDGEDVRSVGEEMEGNPSAPAELDRTVILSAQRIACVVGLLNDPETSLNPDLYIDLNSVC